MHQMHYSPSYPPSYYSPYTSDAMCYSPPYQPYFPAKVYQSAPAYRRYPSYYQPGPPPPPDLYDQPPPSSAPPPPTGSQLVPTGPTAPQHMEHYPGPPGFYSGYSPGGGQCYSRGMQPPYMEYPAPCPCPMQSCPKNVLTGPLIGSSNNNTSSNNNKLSCSSINSNMNANPSNVNLSDSLNSSSNNSVSENSMQLKINKGPVQVPIITANNNRNVHMSHSYGHHEMGQMNPAVMGSHHGQDVLDKNHHHLHHHHYHLHGSHKCKMEILDQSLKAEVKPSIGIVNDSNIYSDVKSGSIPVMPNIVSNSNSSSNSDNINTSTNIVKRTNDTVVVSDNCKRDQYEEVVIPPTPPSNFTINEKLTDRESTLSPARGSTGLPTIPDQTASNNNVIQTELPVDERTVLPGDNQSSSAKNSSNLTQLSVGRKARLGKTMAREIMYSVHGHSNNGSQNSCSNSVNSQKTQQDCVNLHLHYHHHVQQQQLHHQHQQQVHSQVCNQNLPDKQSMEESKINSNTNCTDLTDTSSTIKAELNQINKTEIKIEDEDVVVILDDDNKKEVKACKIEPEIIEIEDDKAKPLDNSTSPIDVDSSISVDNNSMEQFKRIKIHEFNTKASNCFKKTTHNGYKSLIKQAEPKPYLCLSAKRSDRSLRHRRYLKYPKMSLKRDLQRRRILLTDKQKKLLVKRKKKLMVLEQKRQKAKLATCIYNLNYEEQMDDDEEDEDDDAANTSSSSLSLTLSSLSLSSSTSASTVHPASSVSTAITSSTAPSSSTIDSTVRLIIKEDRSSYDKSIKDRMELKKGTNVSDSKPRLDSRGYFSESEVRSSPESLPHSRRANKIKTTQFRSKSETKRSKSASSSSNKEALNHTTSLFSTDVSSNSCNTSDNASNDHKCKTKKLIKKKLLAIDNHNTDKSRQKSKLSKNSSSSYNLHNNNNNNRNNYNNNNYNKCKNSSDTKQVLEVPDKKANYSDDDNSNSKCSLKKTNKCTSYSVISNKKSNVKYVTNKKKEHSSSIKKNSNKKSMTNCYKSKLCKTKKSSVLPSDKEASTTGIIATSQNSSNSAKCSSNVSNHHNNNYITETNNNKLPDVLFVASDEISADVNDAKEASQFTFNTVARTDTSVTQESTDEDKIVNSNLSSNVNNHESATNNNTTNTNNSKSSNNETSTTNSLCRTSTCGKRSRSRPSKFGCRKRQRLRHSQNEIENTILVPRRTNVVPRWNNGWSWEGEPFQGKVFLNSDDPLVVRTCYPAMRHSEGDIIRPRDCVLLKAGNKKNELPYVAKVAQLWENPEDGEMMMSLLWYYRPEHTEQGRQPNDCPDEVFASRHRDHNSVACIEDKCYVLTFSEYCRYRRNVRAIEEGIEEKTSIVPPLHNYSSPHDVPLSTNPEQVMFCQRVYEFRLKRLLKTPPS